MEKSRRERSTGKYSRDNTYRKSSKLGTVKEYFQLDKYWLFVDYLEVQEASNISFSFITESIHDISKFDIYLKNTKRERIKFKETKKKYHNSILS